MELITDKSCKKLPQGWTIHLMQWVEYRTLGGRGEPTFISRPIKFVDGTWFTESDTLEAADKSIDVIAVFRECTCDSCRTLRNERERQVPASANMSSL